MPRDATATRERILDAAHRSILARGFAATSVDHILEGAGISRGTFFYHFPTKEEMARTLIRRYAEEDLGIAREFLSRAEEMVRDPLQQVLVMTGFYIELMESFHEEDPGCLFASYLYEADLFDQEIMAVISQGFAAWRALVGGKLREAMELHETKIPVDPDSLADLGFGNFQGAFILSRVAGSTEPMADQFRHFKRYLELLFGVV